MKLTNIKGMKIKKSMGLALSLAIVPASLFTFTSCDDFLTITPTNSIVEEEYWQDKNDLNNALMGCYKSMTEESFLNRVIYWGEMRSDNCDRSLELSSSDNLANIMNANLLPTYDAFDWTPMYKTINLCNKVLNHGEMVVQTDQSFSEQNWLPIKAEAVAIRSLCYFYLVRSFGEVPYIAETRKTSQGNDTIVHIDINNDSQELRYPQSTQLAILNDLIKDLESVKDIAMTEYGNTVENKGRITKKAIYTLLADIYLWRASYLQGNCRPFSNRSANEYASSISGKIVNSSDSEVANSTYLEDYQKCIEYCDNVIQMSSDEIVKSLSKKYYGTGTLRPQLCDLLVQNFPETEIGEHLNLIEGEAYDNIFGDGNSFESIFELQFDGVTYTNKMVESCYFKLAGSKAGSLSAPKSLFSSVATSPNAEILDMVFTKTDYRRWEALYHESDDGQTEFNYTKLSKYSMYQYNDKSSFVINNTANVKSGTDKYNFSASYRSTNNASFIFYRLPEVYLMKADAITQITSNKDSLTSAVSLVKEVFKRSNPYAYFKNNQTKAADTLKYELFTNQRSLEYLVLAERQREFLCEGKRWFDLVRFAQRHNSTSDMLSLLVRKYQGNQKAVRAKLADMQALFNPVYENELKANYKLYQNGVWQKSKTTGRTDNN